MQDLHPPLKLPYKTKKELRDNSTSASWRDVVMAKLVHLFFRIPTCHTKLTDLSQERNVRTSLKARHVKGLKARLQSYSSLELWVVQFWQANLGMRFDH